MGKIKKISFDDEEEENSDSEEELDWDKVNTSEEESDDEEQSFVALNKKRKKEKVYIPTVKSSNIQEKDSIATFSSPDLISKESLREKETELDLLKAKIELRKLEMQEKVKIEEPVKKEIIEEKKEVIVPKKHYKKRIPKVVEPIQVPIQEVKDMPKENSKPIIQNIFIKFLILFISFFLTFAIFGIIFSLFHMNVIVDYMTSATIGLFITLIVYFVFLKTKKPKIIFQPKVIENVPDEVKLKEHENFDIDLKRCPLCDSRLKKAKVIRTDNLVSQRVKCSNIDCDFAKNLEFKIQ